MYRQALGVGAVAVACTVNLAARDTTTGQETGVARRPMVAAAGTDVVRGRGADAWRSAELADGYHQRGIQQATRGQVFE